jgi:hypothetical protein
LATGTSSTLCDTPSCRPNGSRTSGDERGQTARKCAAEATCAISNQRMSRRRAATGPYNAPARPRGTPGGRSRKILSDWNDPAKRSSRATRPSSLKRPGVGDAPKPSRKKSACLARCRGVRRLREKNAPGNQASLA